MFFKNTELGNDVEVATENSKSDIACKMVLAYKLIFARILRPIVPEYTLLSYEKKFIENLPQNYGISL